MIIVTIILSIILFIAAIWYLSRNHGKLKKMGIMGPEPSWVFGNISLRKGYVKVMMEVYKEYKKYKIYGIYGGNIPVVNIVDPDTIREVMVKQFPNFTNRRRNNVKFGGAIDHMITMLEDEKWKNVRSAVSPAFSTARVKLMGKHVENTIKTLVDNIKEKAETNEEVELKDFVSCFAMDAIASAGFGVQTDTIKNPEEPYVVYAKRIMNSFRRLIDVFLLFPFMIPVLRKLGINILDTEAASYFETFVNKGIAYRKEEEEGKTKRNDFLQLIIDQDREGIEEDHDGTTEEQKAALKTGHERKRLSKLEIQAQALIFILGSYDTLSIAISFTLFLLTHHPVILNKVQEELDEQLAGKLPTYETAKNLPYLDMCISEGLRMYPPVFMLERRSMAETQLQGITIPKDTVVVTPILSIHHDPEIWPEPEKFIPERFTPEAKEARHPFVYLPFGHGPRNCVGMRLAQLEMKMAIAGILQSSIPVPCKKTVYPIELEKWRIQAKDKLWVKFEKRKMTTLNYY